MFLMNIFQVHSFLSYSIFWIIIIYISTFYAKAKQIRGSMIINQTIKIPPVHLPEKEEPHLPQIPERSLHKWLPFGRGVSMDMETSL